MYLQVKKSNIYDSYEMYHKNGSWMCNCSKKKAFWYVNGGLAEWIGENKFQLKFESGGFGNNGKSDYYKEKMKNECVVCGTNENLTRHHVVPYMFVKYFPLEYKTKNQHDIVVMCHECHAKYELTANDLKRKYAKGLEIENSFGNQPLNPFDKLNKKILSARTALKRYAEGLAVIPDERVKRLISFAEMELFDVEVIENNSWSKLLVDTLVKDHKLHEFMVSWRKHFLEHAKPKNMPKYWDVFHKSNPEYE
jgi:hypothetical protein